MLNRAALALLVATSLAPVALVHGVSLIPERKTEALCWLAAALVLVRACLGVMGLAARRGERRVVPIGVARSMDREVLAFLVSYALPLVVPPSGPGPTLAFWTFLALVGLVLYQTGFVHVNPLLGLLGWRFFEVERDGGETALVITRSRDGADGDRRVVALSPRLWLEVPHDAA